MKTLRLLLAISVVGLCCGCGKTKDTSQADGTQTSPDSPPATAAAASVNASFSATLDGVAITGRGVDDMQSRNAAYRLPGPEGAGKMIRFYLWSSKDGGDMTANYSVLISFPDKAGTYTKTEVTDHSCDCLMNVDLNATSGTLARYNGAKFTLNISALTDTRVAGTFSGTFAVSPDTPRAEKKEITVSNGKFDIPFSTSKMIPF